MKIPEVPAETERQVTSCMDDKEKLVYFTLKALRADIAELSTMLQYQGIFTTPPVPETLALGSAE